MVPAKVRRIFVEYDLQLWILFAGWVVSAMGFAMVVPFVSIYFHLELGIPMAVVGTFFLVTAVVRAMSQIIAGNLSDSIGRRKIMLFAQFVRGLVFFGVAIAIHLNWGFLPTALILVMGYLLASFFQPAANAMVADIVPAEKRPEAFGLLKIAANIGWGIGPAAGGFLATHSYSALFWVSGFLAIGSGLTILFFLQESNKNLQPMQRSQFKPKKVFGVFSDKQFLIYCIVSWLMFLTMAQLVATLSVYAKAHIGISNEQLGWIYSLNALIVVVFQLLVSRIIKRFNLLKVMMLGSLIYWIGYSLMAFPSSLMQIFLLIALITVAEMMVGPASSSLVAKIAPLNKYGLYMGAYGLFGTLGWSVGPFIGGLFLDYAPNPYVLWFGVAFSGLLGAIGFFWMSRRCPELGE